MRRLVVAIDGPAGSGKSTLAARLARELDLPYVNTGAMYRALTARAVQEGADLDDGEALAALARRIRFDLSSKDRPPVLTIDGEPPTARLSAPEVEAEVSRVSSHPQVRAVLRAEQRRLGEGGGVLEGRDIGSVVFPDADVKIYLEAHERERVARRARERETDRPERVAAAIAARDARDATVNPFVPAPDARAIDTTGTDPEGVFRLALSIVRSRTEAP